MVPRMSAKATVRMMYWGCGVLQNMPNTKYNETKH